MSKYDFRSSYPGPNGPHLNCLTMFTRTRDESKRLQRRSPSGKRATMARPTTTARKAAAVRGHLQRHPNDGVQASRLAKLEAA